MRTGKGQSDGSIWADSHESLNRCFTMAFCFACFIEQRADIHVNLVLLQSARSCGEYRPPSPFFLFLSLTHQLECYFFPRSSFFPIPLFPYPLLPVNLLCFTIFHQTFSIIRRYKECNTRDKDQRVPRKRVLL